jgi:hypothetical protein
MNLQISAPWVGCLALVLSGALSAQGQGTFENLNFESADLSGYSPASDVPITNALPGWSAYVSTSGVPTPLTLVWYDGISFGGAAVSVVDTNIGVSGFYPLQGQYSAYLFGGGSYPLASTTISQTSLVPSGTESLLMDARVSGAAFIVTLGGQTINMIPLQVFANYTLYGGDVSSFAGQVAALSFTVPPAAVAQPSMFELDNIQFSNQAVPEPGVFGLSVLGVLVLGWRVLGRRRHTARGDPALVFDQ